MQKKKSFDIMLKKNKNQYNHYRKDFFMNIISQNFKNALKNKIKILITPIYYNLIDSIVDNIGNNNFDFSKYFSIFSILSSILALSTFCLLHNLIIPA